MNRKQRIIAELEAIKIGDVKLPKGYNITHPNDAHDEALEKAIAIVERSMREPPTREEIERAAAACTKVLPSPMLQAKTALQSFMGESEWSV